MKSFFLKNKDKKSFLFLYISLIFLILLQSKIKSNIESTEKGKKIEKY
jgi:hypothetical protein